MLFYTCLRVRSTINDFVNKIFDHINLNAAYLLTENKQLLE
jgi:hypothetical protein